MVIFYWGKWRGDEALLWHPKGGYVKPEDALPPEVFQLSRTAKSCTIWARGYDAWTILPVPPAAPAGAFLASARLSAPVMRSAARQAFKILPGVDALLGIHEVASGK